MSSISSEEAFTIWAPDGVLWSEWAKPIAFVQAGETMLVEPIEDAALPTIPGPLDYSSAIIVDLPGADAVYAGLSLARSGYRPVPLFNGTSGPSAVIDVSPITHALAGGAERLKRSVIAPDAPPAFLLDSRRHDGSADLRAGLYDNRWVALPQDFPSGALLASRGINAATVIRKDNLSINPDLAHVLRRWRDNGLRLRVVSMVTGQPAADLTIPKPSGFKLAWYAAIALLGLRRSNVGGFGSVIPVHGGRGGFYG